VKKNGILGGSFDPIHNGHLYIAKKAKELLQLDKVIFVPAARPPHKENQTLTNNNYRLEMITLGIENYPDFIISNIELIRAGKNYTVDTIPILQQLYPNSEFYLIIGADMANDIKNWHRADELLQMVMPVTFERPGYTITNNDVKVLSADLIDVSSTKIRDKVRRDEDISGLVPETVAEFIKDRRLYKK